MKTDLHNLKRFNFREIHILAEMEHDNIIYLHQVYENEQYVILIIEL